MIKNDNLNKNDEIKRIKSNIKFSKSTMNNLIKICNIKEEKDCLYEISDIKDFNLFLYYISKEIVGYQINKYFKNELRKYFDKDKVKEILKNHKEKTFEINYFETLVKTKLLIYFKNNSTLNINSFYKFNLSKLFKDLDNIVDYEVSTDGNFLELEEDTNNSNGVNIKVPFIVAEKYGKLIDYIEYLKEKTVERKELYDIHIYIEDNKLTLVNENNKKITYSNTAISKNEVEDIYNYLINMDKNKEILITKELLFISALIGLYTPERIIIYKSLSKEFINEFIGDFAVLKEGLNISAECYISKELTPKI